MKGDGTMLIVKIYFILSSGIFIGVMFSILLIGNHELSEALEEIKEENTTAHNLILLTIVSILFLFLCLPMTIATLFKRFR